MKILVVLFTLVSVALAAPALKDESTKRHQDTNHIQATRRIPENVTRQKKSPSELPPTTAIDSSVPNSEIIADEVIPIQTGGSFGSKTPVIVKKKYGYRLYHDSEEEKASAESSMSCGREVKVKVCDEDGKFREMLRSHDQEISQSISENDMKHSIMMAKEAIENLQRDFKKIEEKSASSKSDSETDLHQDIEITRQALEDIQKNFEHLETMSLDATQSIDSEAIHDLHVITEEKRMAQWKTAMENIHKNVEIAENIENSFKNAGSNENLLNLESETTASIIGHEMKDKDSHMTLEKNGHMRDAQTINQESHFVENINDLPQNLDKATMDHAREENNSQEKMATSASEVVEMKTVDIGKHQAFKSENHKHFDSGKNAGFDLKEHESIMNKDTENAEEFLEDNVPAVNDEEINENLQDDSETIPEFESSMKNAEKTTKTTKNAENDYLLSPSGATSSLSELTKPERNIEITKESSKENNVSNDSGLEDTIVEKMKATTSKNMGSKLEVAETHESTQSLLEDDKYKISPHACDEQTENIMKAAETSDYVDLTNSNNKSEQTSTVIELKSAEDFSHPGLTTSIEDSSSMKMANPSNQIPGDSHQLQHQLDNFDDKESEHTIALTDMKTAEDDNVNIQLTPLSTLGSVNDNLLDMASVPFSSNSVHETRPLSSLKMADPLHQNDLQLQGEYHNIENNESEHSATSSEMKTAEGNISVQLKPLQTLAAVKETLLDVVSAPFNLHRHHETKPLISQKMADPSDQVPLRDLHVQDKHYNIDEKKSEHTALITEMKTAEDNISVQIKPLETLETVPFSTHEDHETTLNSMKTAEPIDQVSLSDLINKHDKIDFDESDRSTILTEMKTAYPSDQKPMKDFQLQQKNYNIDYNDSDHTATLAEMKSVEDHLEPETFASNVHWVQQNAPLTTMKMANPSDQLSLNHLQLQHKQRNFDDNDSYQARKVSDHAHHHFIGSTAPRATEGSLNHQESIPINMQWERENEHLTSMKAAQDFRKNSHELENMRHSHVADHHFTHNNIEHETIVHDHNHVHYPHIHPHSDRNDMNMHSGSHKFFGPSLRDAIEDLESEHEYQWKPSQGNFRSSYGSSYGANSFSSGGAVGVFPNANSGGCGIPLLLSCSPSVVSGSLAKAHSGSYGSSLYSPHSYRTEDDYGFYKKRDTKTMPKLSSPNVLRSPAIGKQQLGTGNLSSKM